MTYFHIVSFKAPPGSDAAAEQTLVKKMNDMISGCRKSDGSEYVLSSKGGRQNSPEGHDHGIDFVWVMEFANKEDAYYYLDEDPVHQDFKANLKVGGVVVLDFIDNEY